LARYLPSAPQIGLFTASPNPVTAGSSVTLTAGNITDGNPGGTITQGAFSYFDSSGDNAALRTVSPTNPGGWTVRSPTTGWAAGTYTLFAQAEDSYGVVGDPVALALNIQ